MGDSPHEPANPALVCAELCDEWGRRHLSHSSSIMRTATRFACFREPMRYFAAAGWDVDLYIGVTAHHLPPTFDRSNVGLFPRPSRGPARLAW